MDLLSKIKGCQTMRELDDLRREIIDAANEGEDFPALQKAFIKKKNSLRRNGHTRTKDGYTLNDVIRGERR